MMIFKNRECVQSETWHAEIAEEDLAAIDGAAVPSKQFEGAKHTPHGHKPLFSLSSSLLKRLEKALGIIN